MKNKFIIACITLILLLGASTLSFADDSTESLKAQAKIFNAALEVESVLTIEEVIALTEATIYEMIETSQLDATEAIDTSSGKKLEEELDTIIEELLDVTYRVVTEAIDYAADQNVELERFWIPVTIGNREVLVDPIRSVKF